MSRRDPTPDGDDLDRGSLKRRVFVATPVPANAARIPLDAESAHHLSRVLRLPEGAEVDVADGTGRLWRGALQRGDGAPGTEATAEPRDNQRGDRRGDSQRSGKAPSAGWVIAAPQVVHVGRPEAPRRLLVGLIKGPRWDWIIEKAAELGVHELVPILAERSVVRVPSAKVADRVERWQRIADGAARQCERLSRMQVAAPCTVADALAATRPPATTTPGGTAVGGTGMGGTGMGGAADAANVTAGPGLLLLLDETSPLAGWPPWDAHAASPVTLAVGPEGGWTDDERAAFRAAGAASVGLGTNLLRAETAVLMAASLVRALDAGLTP